MEVEVVPPEAAAAAAAQPPDPQKVEVEVEAGEFPANLQVIDNQAGADLGGLRVAVGTTSVWIVELVNIEAGSDQFI